MSPFKTHAHGLVQCIIALTVIVLLLACNTISIFNKSGPTSQSQNPYVQQPTAVDLGGDYLTYEGEINGVKYTIDHPANFTFSSAGGWDEFCLDVDDNLCVGIRRPEGNWSDPEAMATDVMTGLGREVSDFNIYHQQHTVTADGFTAYWVGCTYSSKGVKYEGSYLFVVVQNVGFEIAGYGEPEMMKTYQSTIKKMMESFILVYN